MLGVWGAQGRYLLPRLSGATPTIYGLKRRQCSHQLLAQMAESVRVGTVVLEGDASLSVEEMFDCGAIITGRRTFDIAGGWGGHHPVGAPFFLLTHNPADRHVGPGTGPAPALRRKDLVRTGA